MKNPEPREPPTHRGAGSRSSSPAVLAMAERMAILMGFTWIYDIYICIIHLWDLAGNLPYRNGISFRIYMIWNVFGCWVIVLRSHSVLLGRIEGRLVYYQPTSGKRTCMKRVEPGNGQVNFIGLLNQNYSTQTFYFWRKLTPQLQ